MLDGAKQKQSATTRTKCTSLALIGPIERSTLHLMKLRLSFAYVLRGRYGLSIVVDNIDVTAAILCFREILCRFFLNKL